MPVLNNIGITASNNVNVTFTGQDFNTSLPIAAGSTSITITGTDAANNQVSNNVAISSIGQNNTNTSFDLNGNMTSDGTNTYQYDAENRLVQINYPGTGNNTQIFYDGLGHWVKSIETTNNATTSVIQYLWSGDNLIEERDQNGNVLRRFFSLGEQISGTNYYYVKDHLGSIRQMTDSSGNVVYQADYSAYGQATVSVNTVTPAFGYAGYFVHGRSNLNLTVHRAYSASLARFLNRDLIGESGGVNLYGYVGSDPVDLSDPSGLKLTGWYALLGRPIRSKIECMIRKKKTGLSNSQIDHLVDDIMDKLTNEDVARLKDLSSGKMPSDVSDLNPGEIKWSKDFIPQLSPENQTILLKLIH